MPVYRHPKARVPIGCQPPARRTGQTLATTISAAGVQVPQRDSPAADRRVKLVATARMCAPKKSNTTRLCVAAEPPRQHHRQALPIGRATPRHRAVKSAPWGQVFIQRLTREEKASSWALASARSLKVTIARSLVRHFMRPLSS